MFIVRLRYFERIAISWALIYDGESLKNSQIFLQKLIQAPLSYHPNVFHLAASERKLFLEK